MVLTCLCGCDKVLQTLSVELDLLQQDKEHAEFALDMSRIELGEGQVKEYHISQKALLQEELVTIRARVCDISREMERGWLDYKRMESELCVFRSHLEHICHFGLPQERSLAQKQIWMMDDILSGLKPNRSRFKALMALHTPTMFPLLNNSSLHPEESMHYWGEELEPPARPPLPLELDSTNKGTKRRREWAEPNYRMVYNPATMNTHSSHINTDTADALEV
ncbi:pleckstrin homology domain-containing family A member 4-like [Clarias gariepinus]|uniref:pleckstrin homology domain-containing family A member 4-like n=1 Tax=Clarias gariepinus TaxID=13013 RepID=UPI00234E0882|nr:pleckstrin homology domain-containing family A member 4-like [Clarias gariepinus]